MAVTRETLKALIKQKDEMETEILALTHQLQTGGFGLHGSLVDKEGFPIADAEKAIAVREARGKLARLQNDHIAIMKQIEKDMNTLHETTSRSNQSTTKMEIEKPISHDESTPQTSQTMIASANDVPFLLIDEVFPGSPTDKAGVIVGDRIVQFGSITHSNSTGIRAIADLVTNMENRSLAVRLIREENGQTIVKEVRITPRKWEGRGLLGWHMVPC
eukprot:TRINITY_DN20326_c0_g1_i1.p1 TRINITY_DN20326_c0_g1~~TRINITY_DN20326_c0_g1_i1.p1  ORF type:complete len:217 (+),score=30.88 TRINITY_DN20326_c0_g1_i1:109-759(+)